MGLTAFFEVGSGEVWQTLDKSEGIFLLCEFRI